MFELKAEHLLALCSANEFPIDPNALCFVGLRGCLPLSPWYDEAALDRPTGLATPEWRPFVRRDVHRFIDPQPSRP